MKENILYLGTCSWKYDDWLGLVYSKKGLNNYLKEYATIYNSVEIDQWFYSLFPNSVVLPKKEVVREYSESVSNSFKFTIKMPNALTLTHYPNKSKDNLNINPYFLNYDIVSKFIEILEPLHKKIGVLIFQFEYLNKHKMENQNKFMDLIYSFIEKLPIDFNFGIEIRNPNYINEKYFDFINMTNLWHILTQGYYMPNIYDTFIKFQNYFTKPTVFRLLGDDRKGIEELTQNRWNKIVINRDKEIEQVIKIIKLLKSKQLDCYINVNNHFEGCSPLTIEKIKKFLI